MNATIAEISAQHAFAVVGVSDKAFGGAIYKTLKERGLAVYPVHPTRQTFDGDPCFASLLAIPKGVKTAIIAVAPAVAESVVDDAAKAGLTHLWFQQGKDFSTAAAKAQAKGLQTVSGKCILMYAGRVTGLHSFHRGIVRLFGRL